MQVVICAATGNGLLDAMAQGGSVESVRFANQIAKKAFIDLIAVERLLVHVFVARVTLSSIEGLIVVSLH